MDPSCFRAALMFRHILVFLICVITQEGKTSHKRTMREVKNENSNYSFFLTDLLFSWRERPLRIGLQISADCIWAFIQAELKCISKAAHACAYSHNSKIILLFWTNERTFSPFIEVKDIQAGNNIDNSSLWWIKKKVSSCQQCLYRTTKLRTTD